MGLVRRLGSHSKPVIQIFKTKLLLDQCMDTKLLHEYSITCTGNGIPGSVFVCSGRVRPLSDRGIEVPRKARPALAIPEGSFTMNEHDGDPEWSVSTHSSQADSQIQHTANPMVASRVFNPDAGLWPPLPGPVLPVPRKHHSPIMAPPPTATTYGPRLPQGPPVPPAPPQPSTAQMMFFQQHMMQDIQNLQRDAADSKARTIQLEMERDAARDELRTALQTVQDTAQV